MLRSWIAARENKFVRALQDLPADPSDPAKDTAGRIEQVRLKEGESVVVAGNFLLDAESNLQTALRSFAAPEAQK